MSVKRTPENVLLDYRLLSRTAKSSIFSTVSFAAIFFIIYADSVISNLSMQRVVPSNHEILDHDHQTQIPEEQIKSTSQLPNMQANIDNIEDEIHDRLVPPENASQEERLGWFRRKLPELEILHSDNLTKQFHGRVLEFLDTGCSSKFYMIWLSPAKSFGKREFLALDTLFKSNPQGCLVIVSKSMDSERGYRILKPLLDRGFKILAITPDLPFLVKDTPSESWLEELKSGGKDPGYIPLPQNLANLIRLAMLYKYGGIYLDTDFVILKDFSGLRNAVGAQSIDKNSKQWTTLNNAVMIFDVNHPILVNFLAEFAKTFNGNKWGHNGPYLVSRVIESVGNTPGYNLTILPPKAFYAVDWVRIHRLFRKPKKRSDSRAAKIILNELNDGETYALHLWNKRSRKLVIEEGSVMARLISEHCVICQDIYTS
ncbi:lactosylceramide 4-alpha-galactosyltransferase-like [Pyrus ussuriensis x Pyrus communis]|uniref:Lactosylceramide 4-alpha-galactosyltransferase-like n=1 Tax=Pyrus ussuriensis x Pyrus communis TaxID=2448454 RepID=A0A5N5H259_9ROSA|nr:lactosylceramide 4-alpha-galactosyltransferase-like [Pyrus ussuriensis x Pyrus communis]